MAETPRDAVLYVNVRSRRGAAWFRRSAEALQASGIVLREARGFRKPRNLLLAVKRAAREDRVPLIVVGGGDGTLSAVARCFVGSPSVLGVLPLGTGNSFARDLGLPAQPEQAAAALVAGEVGEVDLGYAGNDYFVNIATVGLTAHIAEELQDEQKRRFGRAVYAFALIRGLAKVKPMRARLMAGSETHEFETLQVVIGNGRFHAGPFPLHPDAGIDEGLLHVYAIQGKSKSTFLRLAMRLPFGTHVDLPDVLAWSLESGRLETDPNAPLVVDGERGLFTPIQFRVEPKAIRVVLGKKA